MYMYVYVCVEEKNSEFKTQAVVFWRICGRFYTVFSFAPINESLI